MSKLRLNKCMYFIHTLKYFASFPFEEAKYIICSIFNIVHVLLHSTYLQNLEFYTKICVYLYSVCYSLIMRYNTDML